MFEAPPWYKRVYRYLRRQCLYLKDLRHRITDYNRLRNEYSQTLIHATRYTLSFTDHDLEKIKATIDRKQQEHHRCEFARELLLAIDCGTGVDELRMVIEGDFVQAGGDSSSQHTHNT